LESSRDVLRLLQMRLSQKEGAVVWLVSQTIPGKIDKLEYFVHELVELANQCLAGSTVASKAPSVFQSTGPEQFATLIQDGMIDLEKREWVKWRDWPEGPLYFQLGIFPLWVRRYRVNLDKVRP